MASREERLKEAMFHTSRLVRVVGLHHRPDLNGRVGKIRQVECDDSLRAHIIMVQLYGFDDVKQFDRRNLQGVHLFRDEDASPSVNNLVRMKTSPYQNHIWGRVVELMEEGMVRVVWLEPMIEMETVVDPAILEVLILAEDGEE